MSRKSRGNVANGENTVIGSGTTINGDIVSDSAVIRVDGRVSGGINTKGDLVIGATGEVNGDVYAANLNMAGRITGDATIGNKIEIEARGRLIGNITAKLMAMDETAIIQGLVNMEAGDAADNAVASGQDISADDEEKDADKDKISDSVDKA